MPIEAWGEVTLNIETPRGTQAAILTQVALVPKFFTSLVSLSRLESSNTYFDSRINALYQVDPESQDLAVICNLKKSGGHWLVVQRDTAVMTDNGA